MLCLRCILFAVFVLLSLVSADPSHNLLAIEVVVVGLLTLIHFTGLIYKRLFLDIIEASFILNLGILAAATYSVSLAETPESQAVVTSISVGIVFTTLVGVLYSLSHISASVAQTAAKNSPVTSSKGPSNSEWGF